MNGSKVSRIFAPAVTIISLAAGLAWPTYAASRPSRKAHYVPRHARPGKVRRGWTQRRYLLANG
jgi:hypothetical protein